MRNEQGEELNCCVWSLKELIRAWGEESVKKALGSFLCSREEDAQGFIRTKAITYEKEGRSRTFLFVDEENLDSGLLRVVGYFTLSIQGVDVGTLDSGKAAKSSSDKEGVSEAEVPAYLIAQLARDDTYTHEQLDGRQMLRTAEELIARASDYVGGQLVFIECKVPNYADGASGGFDLRTYYLDAGYQEFKTEDGYCTLGKPLFQ